jgi:cytoskeletal protein RodZ
LAGEVLKKRREELGLAIKDVSELLKLKPEYLSSIEEDRFEQLPVAVYTIGYIRCYASYLHVDPEPILAFYSGHLSHPQPPTIIPVASSKKKIPFHYYVIPALVLLLAGLVVVIMRQGAAGPEIKMAPAPGWPPQDEKQHAAPANQTLPAAPQALQTQPPADRRTQPQEKSAADNGHRLEIRANDLTWVHITFSQGGTEEALLRPGATKIWTFPDQAMLKIGNAGGVIMNLDGKDIGTPGSSGQVMTLTFPENRQVKRETGDAEER